MSSSINRSEIKAALYAGLTIAALGVSCPHNDEVPSLDGPVAASPSLEEIEQRDTPRSAAEYLNEHFTYDPLASASDDAAIQVARLLNDDGYPPLVLGLFREHHSQDNRGGCALFLYQADNGKYGVVGKPNNESVTFTEPIFNSVDEIVAKADFPRYDVIDLRTIPDWERSDYGINEAIYRPERATTLVDEIK